MEDYLETVAALKNKGDGIVRVRDISAYLAVKSPTVNAALKILSEKGLVGHQKYGYVTLTPKGEKVAGEIQKRHDILVKFLTKILKIDEKDVLFLTSTATQHGIDELVHEICLARSSWAYYGKDTIEALGIDISGLARDQRRDDAFLKPFRHDSK